MSPCHASMTTVTSSQDSVFIINFFRIISGAPNGVYPGGLDLPLDWRVCQEYRHTSGECAAHNAAIMNYTDDQIMECYRSLRSGLVYTCPLSEGNCSPFISNGTVPGGYLYDSIGMSHCIDV